MGDVIRGFVVFFGQQMFRLWISPTDAGFLETPYSWIMNTGFNWGKWDQMRLSEL